MTKELEAELKAAGYTEAQIAKEAAYLDRVAKEDAYFAKYPSYVADHGQE
jgi:hypothetical protein